jgi:LysM repeat protein
LGLMWWFTAAIVGLLVFPAVAEQQVSVVEPGDISTPTPTVGVPLYSILPTPTSTPHSDVARPQPQAGDAEESYTVLVGDTLWRVALEIGVDLDEIPCMVSPQFRPDQPLVVGGRLDFMPLGWRCHTATPG